MKKLIFQGVGTALVTPFIEHLINFEEYKKMLREEVRKLEEHGPMIEQN